MDGSIYLADAIKRFREAHAQCQRALDQVPYARWNLRLDPESNSLVTLMLHLSGNMLSRWTDFLVADGEKPDRNRDAEFEDPASLTRDELLDQWGSGWSCLFQALEELDQADLERTQSQPRSFRRSSSMPKWCASSCRTVVVISARSSCSSWQSSNSGAR